MISMMQHAPLCFEPFLRPMVWGGQRLRQVLGKPLPTPEPYGESWEISDHPLHRSRVATGKEAGRTLDQLMQQERVALLGSAAPHYATFPWLVKFLDACDWLSVQVHPDDEAARKLWPGEGGKTEAWFILDALPESRVYAGLRPGVDAHQLQQALSEGTVADCLHSFQPEPGDCIFLPAGTVHAVGGGVLFAEVQQTSDATFRLFDWNRRDSQGKSRALHIEQALACIDWKRGPVEPIRVPGFGSATVASGVQRQALVRCPFFNLDFVRANRPFPCGGEGMLQLFIVIQGSGRWRLPNGEHPIQVGQAWLLPAAMPPIGCDPNSTLAALHCTLPSRR